MSRWSRNGFWQELVQRLGRQEAGTDFESMRVNQATGMWHHAVGPLEAPPMLLQGRELVVDVTDRAVRLLPLRLSGRFRLEVGFDLSGGRNTVRDANGLEFGIGRAVLFGVGWRVVIVASPVLPVVDIELHGLDPAGAWVSEDGREVLNLTRPAWLTPDDFEMDSLIERNNSSIPDPKAPLARRAGVFLKQLGNRIVMAVAEAELEGTQIATEWEDRRNAELRYWERIGERLRVDLPDTAITRQARYSVHNSLFSRSRDERGRDIFIHGRRDRGYASAAHLHQSYQMHFVALAAGETRSVRDELLSFCSLQNPNGWIERAPHPFAGSSLYVGRYTGAHLLLAAERYLVWSGDFGVLSTPVESTLDDPPRSFFERVDLAAADLLAHRYDGLVGPCGWADAWNPDVRAQGQISATAVLALRAWSRVCANQGRHDRAAELAGGAESIAARMRERLVDPSTGIVAEHVFDDRVTGGTVDDYFAHTQIWSALAGIIEDGRALDLVKGECLNHGVSIAPESAFDKDYVAASTDSTADLPIESTATWLLASWPEVTHLLALAEIDRQNPDDALAAVLSQLPESLHQLNPVCAPYYYAEKYLYPGTKPWLCTWAGDPSLLEVVVSGFLGVHAELDRLVVSPTLPSQWVGSSIEVQVEWRGFPVTVAFDPGLEPGIATVDGFPCELPIEILADSEGVAHTVRVSSAPKF